MFGVWGSQKVIVAELSERTVVDSVSCLTWNSDGPCPEGDVSNAGPLTQLTSRYHLSPPCLVTKPSGSTKKMKENMVHATIFLFVYLYQWLTNVHGIFSYGINIPWKMECEEVLPFTCRVPWVFSWGKLPIKSWSLQRRHRKSMHIRCVILGLEDWNRKKKPTPTCSVRLEHFTYEYIFGSNWW